MKLNHIKVIQEYQERELPDISIPCLDHGFVRLVDFMGSDDAIVQAARVSYGKGTKTILEDEGLIRYLLRNRHTTPFEMVEFKFHCKMPILVARQWIRHRTANVNEYSARYSELDNEYYIPDIVGLQSETNKQGQGFEAEENIKTNFQNNTQELSELSYKHYKASLDAGVARELARMNLPVNFYTQWYWKIDLHNLFHFLKLRMDHHAQYEIRVFANAMYELIKPIVPVACRAFENYVQDAKTFSDNEMAMLRESFITFMAKDFEDNEYFQKLSKREQKEFLKKLEITS